MFKLRVMSFSYVGHRTSSKGGIVHLDPYQKETRVENHLPETHYRATPTGLNVNTVKPDKTPRSVILSVSILVVALVVFFFAKKKLLAKRTRATAGSSSDLTPPILKAISVNPPAKCSER